MGTSVSPCKEHPLHSRDTRGIPASEQGLALVHISAQPEPFLKPQFTLHSPFYTHITP